MHLPINTSTVKFAADGMAEPDFDGSRNAEDTLRRHLQSIEEARIELQESMATLQLGDFNLDATIAKAQRIFTDLKTVGTALKPYSVSCFSEF